MAKKVSKITKLKQKQKQSVVVHVHSAPHPKRKRHGKARKAANAPGMPVSFTQTPAFVLNQPGQVQPSNAANAVPWVPLPHRERVRERGAAQEVATEEPVVQWTPPVDAGPYVAMGLPRFLQPPVEADVPNATALEDPADFTQRVALRMPPKRVRAKKAATAAEDADAQPKIGRLKKGATHQFDLVDTDDEEVEFKSSVPPVAQHKHMQTQHAQSSSTLNDAAIRKPMRIQVPIEESDAEWLPSVHSKPMTLDDGMLNSRPGAYHGSSVFTRSRRAARHQVAAL